MASRTCSRVIFLRSGSTGAGMSSYLPSDFGTIQNLLFGVAVVILTRFSSSTVAVTIVNFPRNYGQSTQISPFPPHTLFALSRPGELQNPLFELNNSQNAALGLPWSAVCGFRGLRHPQFREPQAVLGLRRLIFPSHRHFEANGGATTRLRQTLPHRRTTFPQTPRPHPEPLTPRVLRIHRVSRRLLRAHHVSLRLLREQVLPLQPFKILFAQVSPRKK